MATGAQVWSTAAASNNSADSSVNWAEGMAPSAVNNSARAEMASVAMHIKDNSGTLLTSGSTTAYTVTSMQVQTAVTDGYTMAVRFHATNDSSATLNVDGVGAKKIEIAAGVGLAGGEFPTGSVARLTYTASSTSWVVNNVTSLTTASFPSATIASSFTVTKATLLSSALTVSGAATLSSSLTVGLATLFTTGITAAAIAGDMVATQENMETGTSLITAVSPGRFQFHPGATKGWILADNAGGIGNSYNVTSVADNGPGDLTVSWATDFSTADSSISATPLSSAAIANIRVAASAAGSVQTLNTNSANSAADITGYYVQAWGDFA